MFFFCAALKTNTNRPTGCSLIVTSYAINRLAFVRIDIRLLLIDFKLDFRILEML